MRDAGVRLLYEAFMAGAPFAAIDDDNGLRLGTSEDWVRSYIGRMMFKPRSHWHRGSCGVRRRLTNSKDHVTCRLCIQRLKTEGRWE